MRKLSILVQWIIVAGFVCLIAYSIWRPVPRPDYEPATWQSWEGFSVVSYAGIGRRSEPRYPSVKRLQEHLTALRKAGFQTVRPEDVLAFLEGRRPLPEKALLLIFEGGRKEAFIRATPILQRTGFRAVIAVPTANIARWGSFYLKRREITRAARLPQWDFGGMGHRACDKIEADSTGGRGPFLTRRRWLGHAMEDPAAFQDRVLQDYAESARILTEALGHPPLFFLYPFGDAGQTAESDPLALAINREGVTRHYRLAFAGGRDPFNGPDSDPWSLTRLRARGDWSAAQLLDALAWSEPRREPFEGLGRPEDWRFDGGGLLQPNELGLLPKSFAWLRGTEGWTDAEVSAELRRGQESVVALYARYANPRSWLRGALEPSGLRVQERLADRIRTLHRHAADLPTGEPQRVRLRVRNNRVWVWLNGDLIATNLSLTPVTHRGRIGLGAEIGPLYVSHFEAQPLPARLALAGSISAIPAERRSDLRAILPAWFGIGEPTALTAEQRQELQDAMAAGIETIPIITGAGTISPEAAQTLATTLDDDLLAAGVKSSIRVLALDGPAESLAEALRERGYRVAHLLSAAQAVRLGRNLAQLWGEDLLILNESSTETDQALETLLHWIPASRIAVLEPPSPKYGESVRTALLADQLQRRIH